MGGIHSIVMGDRGRLVVPQEVRSRLRLEAGSPLALVVRPAGVHQGESGADEVEQSLAAGAVCGAASWAEVAQKIRSAGRAWDLSAALLASYELAVEPVTRSDAETAAQLWTPEAGLSLGDRLCLALAVRRRAVVMTADQRWGTRVEVDPLTIDVLQIR